MDFASGTPSESALDAFVASFVDFLLEEAMLSGEAPEELGVGNNQMAVISE